ncbi:MAG TPA: TlpA disulfide reductase family protein [Thermomicrobiaceae bacterium]|nr:TlpA disulfide reductase family protein [Thermomicrobiaceae bacterium]
MPVETGTKAPPFTLPDADGATHRLEDALARGPVVVGLYKSSCQASKTMFPFLERLFQGYSRDRLTVWGVSQDSPNVTKSFARRYGITFPILVDQDDYAVSRDFDILATPTVFVLNPSGEVVWQAMGFQKPAIDELSGAVAGLLGVDPVDLTSGTDDVSPWVPG